VACDFTALPISKTERGQTQGACWVVFRHVPGNDNHAQQRVLFWLTYRHPDGSAAGAPRRITAVRQQGRLSSNVAKGPGSAQTPSGTAGRPLCWSREASACNTGCAIGAGSPREYMGSPRRLGEHLGNRNTAAVAGVGLQRDLAQLADCQLAKLGFCNGPGLSRVISPLATHPFRRGCASVRGRRAGRHLMGFERIGRPI
jgi:hypothetical protein